MEATVSTSKSELELRSKDLSYHEPHFADAVVSVYTEQDVRLVLEICNR